MSTQHKHEALSPFMVQRTLLIPALHCEKCAKHILSKIGSFDGMEDIKVNLPLRKLYVKYDVLQLRFNDIRNELDKMGYPVSRHWWLKVRYAIYQYQDENIRGNAAKGGACCSNPSDIYAKRKHRH